MDMTERRGTATNLLSTVIDALQLGKKTGVLTVERGAGKTFEEGTMVFLNGQIINAHLGPYQGKEATARLFTWQACRFLFTSTEAEATSPQAESPLPPAGVPEAGSTAYPLSPDEQMDRLHSHPFHTTDTLESLETTLLRLNRQGFTRTHRRLFLLIDGNRSIAELADLLRRTPQEVLFLLSDLEQAGFIQALASR